MATFDDVRRIAMALPETSERVGGQLGGAQWRVKDKMFAWDRPLGTKDRAALGDAAPTGDILAARVADEGEKQALIASDPAVYFTIPHFDGYAAILVRLDAIDATELEELLTDAWLLRAPKRLAAEFRETPTTPPA
jgi:hypothetical protein